MGEIFNNLEYIDQVIVPTDKTNSFRCLSMKEYMTMVNKYFRSSSNEIDRDKARDIFKKSRDLLYEVGFQ